MARKNQAAKDLAELRMKRMTAAERSDVASKGGQARASKLSAEERRRIASEAGKAGAAARWGKAKANKAKAKK